MSDLRELTASQIERALRWALIEQGSAALSDDLGADVLVPSAPAVVIPACAAIAGPVVLMHRPRAGTGGPAQSSFDALRAAARPGVVVLVHCEPGAGAAFGSNIALHAGCMRVQAIVTDGKFRDKNRLTQVGAVCGGSGSEPGRPAGAPLTQVQNESMFGTEWCTGDWFLRDADGVLRLPADLAVRTASRLADGGNVDLSALLGPR